MAAGARTGGTASATAEIRRSAPEAATASLDDVFDRGATREVVSMTAVGNAKSRRVMEQLGLTRDPADDFDHSLLAEDHPLRRHVLYRVRRAD